MVVFWRLCLALTLRVGAVAFYPSSPWSQKRYRYVCSCILPVCVAKCKFCIGCMHYYASVVAFMKTFYCWKHDDLTKLFVNLSLNFSLDSFRVYTASQQMTKSQCVQYFWRAFLYLFTPYSHVACAWVCIYSSPGKWLNCMCFFGHLRFSCISQPAASQYCTFTFSRAFIPRLPSIYIHTYTCCIYLIMVISYWFLCVWFSLSYVWFGISL